MLHCLIKRGDLHYLGKSSAKNSVHPGSPNRRIYIHGITARVPFISVDFYIHSDFGDGMSYKTRFHQITLAGQLSKGVPAHDGWRPSSLKGLIVPAHLHRGRRLTINTNYLGRLVVICSP